MVPSVAMYYDMATDFLFPTVALPGGSGWTPGSGPGSGGSSGGTGAGLTTASVTLSSVAAGSVGYAALAVAPFDKRTVFVALLSVSVGLLDKWVVAIEEVSGVTVVATHFLSSPLTGSNTDTIPFTLHRVQPTGSTYRLRIDNSGTTGFSATVTFALAGVA